MELKKLNLCFGIIAALLFQLPAARAEDDARGRLPDGRAYRTDEDGVQLVDYVAELELTIESLQRQVQGLESEARERQAVMASLQKSGQAPRLSEKDIPSKSAEGSSSAAALAAKQECERRVTACEGRLDDQKTDYDVKLASMQKTLGEAQSEISSLKSILEKKQQEIEALQVKLEAAESQEKTVVVSSAGPASASQSRSLVTQDRLVAPAVAIAPESAPRIPANLEQTRSNAVRALSARILRDVTSLESLLASRNALYQKYTRQAPGAELNPEDSSSVQQKIAELRSRVRAAVMVHELSDIRSDINIVRGQLQQEIAMMRRVVR
ncbi:MAG: hypothetical protein J5J00_00480 [Deltaproteobacteria bacterium]|nr:hypothetical protein [Deltaproteobacteria bacterium]